MKMKGSRPPSVAVAVEQISTSHNERFSEMAVGVEARSLLHPMTHWQKKKRRFHPA